jgi:hypothetical protein
MGAAPGSGSGAACQGPMNRCIRVAAASVALLLSACAAPSSPVTETPAMRWDFHPEAPQWTGATLDALEGPGAVLAALVPQDIDTWCPGYAENSLEERRAFWAGVLSALAEYESTWNPEASGGGGRWIGLLQIDPRTARGYGCQARDAGSLKDGELNLSCAVRIASVQVARDNMVAGNGTRGIGRDWAPLRRAWVRREMAEWTRAQDYCREG